MHCNDLKRTIAPPSMRRLGRWLGTALLATMLTACGGGGGSGGNGGAGGGTNGTSAADNAGSATSATPQAANVQDVVVEAGPANGVNALFTSVTVCAPGDASSCATIDHVLVDTGSSGLRLLSSTLPASLKLDQQLAANGNALVECTQFADGYSWGPVRLATLKLGGESIPNLPIQVIGDSAYGAVPAACSATGPAENTVADFGANGVLGIGNFAEDCGGGCAGDAATAFYYACTGASCSSTSAATSLQVHQPVALLPKDNNGVLLRLPAVPAGGAVSLTGSMIFGIGTESNNGLGAARVLTLNPATGNLPISINGVTYPNSFIDSGSNAWFFPSPGTPLCSSGFYCPASPLNLSAVLQGQNGINASLAFTVDNADAFFKAHPSFAVVPGLGGTAFDDTAVDFGLPFFYGRTVYTAIDGRSTPGGAGPYVAF